MTSKIGVKKIIYPNGTDAITIGATGALTVHSTDSSTFAGKIMANKGITAYGNNATGVDVPILITDENSNEATFGLTNAGHLAVRNYNSNADIYFSDDSNNVNLRLYNDGTLKGMTEGGGGLDINFTQGSIKSWSSVNQTGSSHVIEDSYNVSSVNDGGIGNTDVSFTNNMNNANYSVTLAQQDGGSYNDAASTHTDNADPYSTSQIGYYCHFATSPNDANTAWCQVAGDMA